MKNKTVLLVVMFACLFFASSAQNDAHKNMLVHNADTIIHGSGVTHFPYPVIFIHGLVGSAESWTNFKNFAVHRGWTYGGKLPICLNADFNDTSENITLPNSKEIKSFIPANLPAADFYAISFNVDTDGTSYSSDTVSATESSAAAIIKGGKAIGMAIKAVLAATGKDKVILFCHSMGGLDARAYIQNSPFWQSDGQHHVAKLVTSGTPHGGSNTWGGPILDYYEQVDEQSDGVRDLRTTYSNSGEPGVFLFGGVESADVMNDSWFFNFHSFDVNCNGHIGDTIAGLNQRPMPTDIDYTCIVSDYHLDITDSCGDYLVLCNSANIKNYFPNLISETFGADTLHIDMPSLIYQNYLALDEPDSFNLSYHVDTNVVYNGYITQQAPDARHVVDYDNYNFTISQQGLVNVNINYIPVDTFGFSIIDLSTHNILYADSAVGDTSLVSPTLTLSPGNYNLEIRGKPNLYSWNHPYDFIIHYSSNSSAGSNFYSPVSNLTIYPNPALKEIILKSLENSDIEIYNIEGKLLKSFPIKEGRTTIDISAFPQGVYLVKSETVNGISVKKFVKE